MKDEDEEEAEEEIFIQRPRFEDSEEKSRAKSKQVARGITWRGGWVCVGIPVML